MIASRHGLTDVHESIADYAPQGSDATLPDLLSEPRLISAVCGGLRVASVYAPNGREVDGSLHLGVPDAQLPAAIVALTALGLHPITEESDPTGEAGAPLDAGIIGAILRGPRS